MWSEGGLERLRGAVRARLRAVLDSDCPPLEPRVRAVLEQRLDSAALDLMELIRSGEDPVPVENVKLEPVQVKQEPEMSDLNIVCVKMEPEEQEIQPRPEPPVLDLKQELSQNLHQAEAFLYCPQCGSSLGAQDRQTTPSLQPLHAQPRCSLCGQSSSNVLLLEHNYTQDLQSIQGALERGEAEFRCSVCGQDFSQVGALLEHMSQHLSLSAAEEDSEDGEAWSFEDDAFDGTSQETICSICGDVFTDSEQLMEHLRTHLR